MTLRDNDNHVIIVGSDVTLQRMTDVDADVTSQGSLLPMVTVLSDRVGLKLLPRMMMVSLSLRGVGPSAPEWRGVKEVFSGALSIRRLNQGICIRVL